MDLETLSEYLLPLWDETKVILPAILSYLASRYMANKDIRKLRMEIEQKEQDSFDADFSEMIRLVNRLESNWIGSDDSQAISAIQIVRSRSSGPLAQALDDLSNVLYRRSLAEVPDALRKCVLAKANVKGK